VGTTGESPTLDHEEHIRVIETVVDQVSGRVPIIAGTGSNSTAEAIRLTRLAAEVGATATLQVAPYYNKPTPEGIYRHFAAIAESTELPVIVYNIQGRTSVNIDNKTMLRLAEIPNIQGVKEASGDLSQVMGLISEASPEFAILSGDDSFALPITLLGGTGVVSVASNIVPGLLVELVEAALADNLAEARRIHYQLLPLFTALFYETNPIPIKYALARSGAIEESYRLPLSPMSPENKRRLDGVLSSLGL